MIRQIRIKHYLTSQGQVGLACTRDFIFPKKLKRIEQFLEDIEVFPIKDDSKIYFSKSVTFPRVKFREWVNTRNINITRKIEYGDYLVIDSDEIESIIKSIYKNGTKELCKNADGDFILFHQSAHRQEYESLHFPEIIKSTEVYTVSTTAKSKKDIAVIEDIADILVKQKELDFKVVDIIDMVNSTNNSDSISAENVLDIISIIKNKDSKELGLEILYNCNYSDSLFFIAFICAIAYTEVFGYTTPSVNRKAFIQYMSSIGLFSKNGSFNFSRLELDNIKDFLFKFKELNLYHLVDRKFIYGYIMDKVLGEIKSIANLDHVSIINFDILYDGLTDPEKESEYSIENIDQKS